MTMAIAWASLGSVSALLLDAALVWSLVRPEDRLWPPPDGRIGGRTYAIWALSMCRSSPAGSPVPSTCSRRRRRRD